MKTLKKNLTLACMVLLLGMSFGSNPAQAQTFAYVTNTGSSTVSVIATASNTVVATVGVGLAPIGVAITPDGAFAYVTNGNSNTVSVIATASNTVVATVAVGSQPIGVAITPDGAFAYVTNFNSNEVSVIATASNTVVATIAVGSGPGRGVAITPNGAFAYVANSSSNDVSVIATASNTVVATVVVGSGPFSLAITPDGAFVYVVNSGPDDVSVIATASNTVVATVPVGLGPSGIAITPDGAFAYVTNASDDVSVIATASNTVVVTVVVGRAPIGVAITPDGAFAYVVNRLSDNVSVIATASNTVVATVAVGFFPQGVAITPNPSPVVSITLTPINPPIQIPAAGGQFGFMVTLTNNSDGPQSTQVWNMIMLPNGEAIGPTIGPINVTLGPGETINPTLTQEVPGGVSEGQYTYIFNVGTFPNTVDDSDSFPFTKLGAASALQKSRSGETDNWAVIGADGWESLIVRNKIEVLPDGFELEQNYPNPFNPETEIRFQIPQASQVLVRIYNTLGQEIRTLVDSPYAAGYHTVRWDSKNNNGNAVSSGIYLYQLQASSFSQIRKMTLLR